ncbi:uncharacterized protein V1510DRAFT_417553 [Dipodascopsis tothii]|uniref:uncharacterized protein n=1 Tax=Dipodascopsis tothii TaxID=44089 RepID=UPI0034CDFFDD
MASTSPARPATAAGAREQAEVRLQVLRSEIAQRSVDLRSLEAIARELPRHDVSSETSPALSSVSFASSRSSSCHNPAGEISSTPDYHLTAFGLSGSYRVPGMDWRSQDNGPPASASSSKVIESLQNSLDALKRDLTFQTERADEERRSREALQHKFESLSEQYDVARHQNDMFDSILSRKERKIRDLEERLRAETERRQAADASTVELTRARATAEAQAKEAQDRAAAEIATETERRQRAEAAYETVQKASADALAHLRADVAGLRGDLDRAREARAADAERAAELERTLDAAAAERAKLAALQDDIARTRAAKVELVAADISRLRKDVDARAAADEDLVQRTNEALQHLQWIRNNAAETAQPA